MLLEELPHLKRALDYMGIDSGANVIKNVVIPPKWELRAQIAEDELCLLSTEQIETLAAGEESEQAEIKKLATAADEILTASFDDGELVDVFFTPWGSIYDARAAERKYYGS